MNIETEPFKGGKRNLTFPCGMVDKPYTARDRCRKLAVVRVTDDGWHEYQNYRIRYNKMKKCGCHPDLPVLMQPLLCQHHLDELAQLDDNPKEAVKNHG